ncbi:MAG: lysine--tRNA ligase [Nitrospira sp.]|nr:lysine--tRNA ligase [Nitrospira sp.]
MEELNDQIQQRLKKLEELRAMGIQPYGGRFEAQHKTKALREQYEATRSEDLEQHKVHCVLAGRIMTMRHFGKACFAHLQDEAGQIQVYFKNDVLGQKQVEVLERLDLGDLVGVKGHLFRTKTKELTILVEELTLLSKSLRPLPEKWHGLTDIEIRYRQRYLDLIANPQTREIFRQRSRIIEAIRVFLNQRGFVEVETPMMQAVAGGATARPFVTHHHALDTDLYLRIAPELYLKRLVVGGFEKVYEINRNFRNEGISTVHNPEFTMLEFYMTYADYQDLIPFTEQMVTFVARETLGTLKLNYQGHEIDLTPPWPRLNYLEATIKYNNLDPNWVPNPEQVRRLAQKLKLEVKGQESTGKLLDQVFSTTVEPHLTGPVFIMDYPTDLSPLAKRKQDQPELTERFELYIAGRETANAFSELNDPLDQRRRFEDQMRQRKAGDTEAHQMDEDYLRALEYGMPPAAGEGVGIDRLTMLLTNQASIRDVILFPQMRPEK